MITWLSTPVEVFEMRTPVSTVFPVQSLDPELDGRHRQDWMYSSKVQQRLVEFSASASFLSASRVAAEGIWLLISIVIANCA
jgi:hypothetical protein